MIHYSTKKLYGSHILECNISAFLILHLKKKKDEEKQKGPQYSICQTAIYFTEFEKI